MSMADTNFQKRAPFELRVGAFLNYELEVISFRGRERINDVYRYEVTFVSKVAEATLHASLFGEPGCLTIKTASKPSRVIQGLVASVEALGGVAGEQKTGSRRYRVTLVPKLWLMKRRRKNRVFQQKSVPEIVKSMLTEVGMTSAESRWRAVAGDFPPLPFVYQRNESDYDFFRRVLADAGLFFFFEHASGLLPALAKGTPGPSGETVLNFAQLPLNTPSISDGGAGSEALEFDDGMGADSASEGIYEFELKKRLSVKALRLHERDVGDATNWVVEQDAPKPTGGSFALDASLVSATVLREEHYQVDSSLPLDDDDKSLDKPRVARELLRARGRYLEARGLSDCSRLGAGYRFKLSGHPIKGLAGEYTVTALDATGTHPDYVREAGRVYENRFRCIPSSYAPLPARPKARPKLGMELAQVVAYSDIAKVPYLESSPNGYVKVRFAWDIVDKHGVSTGMLKNGANHPSGTDDAAAVWVPVMQPWAGAGFGTQFIPREGMDVVVGFLGDQGERPVILGCVYSAANPLPWSAKNDQQKVGIRSKSRAANGGYSELSIDDCQGKEVVTFKAQTDLSETVGNDRTATVGNDDSLTVTKDRSVQIGGNDSETVTGSVLRTVIGTDTATITGDSTTTLAGNATRSTGGTTKDTMTGDVTFTLGGALDTTVAGETNHSFGDDYTERHSGHRTIVVGSGDAHRAAVLHIEGMGRAYAAMTFEVEVLQSFTLVCGNSQLLVSPGGITLSSPNISLVSKEVDVDAGTFDVTASGALTLAGKTATLETSGAQVALDSSSANVTASAVKFGSGSGTVSSQTAGPVKITTVQMKDSTGKPRANARVLLVKGGKGGEQRMTVLDADGELELIGDSQYQISFPDDPVAK
jgi:type VI secretion system secreted protein VgrG